MQKRYHTFNQRRQDLRAMLYNTAAALEQNDFTDRYETKALFEKLEKVIFYKQSTHQEKFSFPAVEKHIQQLVKEFEKEDETGEALKYRLRNLKTVYSNAISDGAMQEAGKTIYTTFREFLAFHMY